MLAALLPRRVRFFFDRLRWYLAMRVAAIAALFWFAPRPALNARAYPHARSTPSLPKMHAAMHHTGVHGSWDIGRET